MNKPELLAPCGDYTCFISAVNAGADAVYLSGNKFGARAYATNFSEEELIKAINYAHLFDVKVYLTLNTLLKENEMGEVFDYLLPMYEEGLDGVIVQDIGCISYIRKHFPDLPVHASTQMAITGSEGVKQLMELGVSRVVLARELSMDEIDSIYKETGIELECFVHGALCYSYSGKCLFSSLVGGRSGNRGRCAGPCRQPYNNDEYLLSTKDICCLKLIPSLCNGAIASFKIEGRMKSPEYVYGVTAIYRKYIDKYFMLVDEYGVDKATELFDKDKSLEKDYNTLVSLYTRGGNSEGYYYQYNGKKMISIKDASYKKGSENVVDEGSDITDSFIKRIPVYGYISVSIENGAMLTVSSDDYSATASVSEVSPSENKPLTEETVYKQLSKTGNTVFYFDNITYDIESNVFMRVSDLNELRRIAFEKLTDSMLDKYKRSGAVETVDISENIDSKECDTNDNTNTKCFSTVGFLDNVSGDILFNAEICNYEQLNILLKNPSIYGIYVPYAVLPKDLSNLKKDFDKYNKALYVKFPSVIRNGFLKKNANQITNILDVADGVLADNYEIIYDLKRRNYDGKIIGDIHMYALNRDAKVKLNDMGVDTFTVPVELNKKELLSTGYAGDELIVYGRLPMMVSVQCINKTTSYCDSNKKEIYIKDRIGAKFLCSNECSICTNTIYNSIPLSLQGEREFIDKLNPRSVRFVFTDEDNGSIDDIINGFSHSRFDGSYKLDKITKGHLQRGIL